MATSGTTAWTLDTADIIDEAYSYVRSSDAGPISGEDARRARQALNMVITELINKGAPLSALEYKELSLVKGQTTYTLPTSVIDVMNVSYKTYNASNDTYTDRNIGRMNIFEYNGLSNKNTEGGVSLYSLDRARIAPVIYLYPTPNDSNDKLGYWCINRVEDILSSADDVDLSFRYMPALVSRLAWKLSLIVDGADANKRMELKATSDELLRDAQTEDRDRTSFRFIPKIC